MKGFTARTVLPCFFLTFRHVINLPPPRPVFLLQFIRLRVLGAERLNERTPSFLSSMLLDPRAFPRPSRGWGIIPSRRDEISDLSALYRRGAWRGGGRAEQYR